MKISASTNPPEIALLKNYISSLNMKDIDFIHADIMDGKFVENKTFDHKMIIKLREVTSIPFDVHLMTLSPQKKIKKYIKAGADIVTIHYETFKDGKHLIKTLQRIRKLGAFAGLSFRPDTSVEAILPYLSYVDVLLVMSVMPGKSGQTFMPETLQRIEQINAYLLEEDLSLAIEVDGGVNDKNIASLKALDVNMVVLGNYLYSSKNIDEAIEKIK